MASSPSSKQGGSGPKKTAKSSPSAKRPNPKSKAARNAAAKAAAKSATRGAPSPDVTAGMTGIDKVVWICLHLLVFLVPVAMSNFNWLGHFVSGGQMLPLTYDQFDICKVFVMRACALVGLGAWAFQFFFRGGKLRHTKLDWLILGFLGWVLLTSFTSISPATAFFGKYRRYEGFFSFLTYAVVYFLVVQLVDRTSRIRSIARTLMFSSFIVAGYGVLQYAGLDPINWGTNLPFEANRAFSTFGNPDLLAGFLIFPLAISVALALSEKKTGWRIFYWATFLVTTASWIVAFTRGAWIGGVLALAILIVAAILARPKLNAVDWSFAGLTGLAGVALVVRSLASSSQVMNVWNRLQSILQSAAIGSDNTRYEIWQAAISAIKARPLFGFGADTFRLVFPLYKPLDYVKDAGYLSVADNVHDYPLQLAAGIGIIGFLLLYGLFGWALWLGAPNAFSRGKGAERLVIAGFWAASVGYLMHLMTGLSVTGSSVFLWIALAIIVSPTARETHHDAPASGAMVGTLLIVVLALASIYNVVYIAADNFFLQGQFPTAGQDPVALTKTAIAMSPYNDTYRSMLGKIYEGDMTSDMSQASSDQAAGKDPSGDLQAAKTAFLAAEDTYKNTIALVPTEYDNYLFISALYNEAGSYFDPAYFDQAIAWADKGIAVEPFGPGVRLQKAVAQASTGDVNGALATIEAAVPMDPNYSDPYLFEAQLLTQMGRYTEAAADYKHLLSLSTTQAAWAVALKSVEASAAAAASGTGKP